MLIPHVKPGHFNLKVFPHVGLPGLDLLKKKDGPAQQSSISGMPDMEEIRKLFMSGKPIRHLVPPGGGGSRAEPAPQPDDNVGKLSIKPKWKSGIDWGNKTVAKPAASSAFASDDSPERTVGTKAEKLLAKFKKDGSTENDVKEPSPTKATSLLGSKFRPISGRESLTVVAELYFYFVFLYDNSQLVCLHY